jgi:putative transcriptional regulator
MQRDEVEPRGARRAGARLFSPCFYVRVVSASKPESLQGQLLISSGGLYDPNFRHTVVLIGVHNADGALGVVLNRALEMKVADVLPGLSSLVAADTPLYQGGPVQPQSPVLLAELARPELASLLVFGTIGFLVGEVPDDIGPSVLRARVYAGYAGWGPGQLEAEMKRGSWITDPARPEDVFTEDPDQLWRRILERKGPEYKQVARIPFDPSMN